MTLKDARYGLWREYDPEDTVRFYALRLHEAGMIKKTPNEDHLRIHRLALPRGDQARAEDLKCRPRRDRRRPFMQIMQN